MPRNSFPSSAAQAYLRAVDAGDKAKAPVRVRLEAAAALYKAARLEAAEAVYKNVLEKRPASRRALAGLGRIAQARGNSRSALACYRAAAAAHPASTGLKLRIASQLRRLARLNEAKQVYDSILAEQPDHDVARARLQKLARPRASGLPRMERSWLDRPTFVHADEWGRNLEALGVPAFGMSPLTLAQDFACGASEQVRRDCILVRRDDKTKILPLVSDWEAYERILRREAAALPPGSLLGYVPEPRGEGGTGRFKVVESHREFVYRRSTVATMEGASLASHRRQVRSLLKAGAHVEPIGPPNLDRVLACNARWFVAKKAHGRKTYYRGRTLWTLENLSLLEPLGVRHLAAVLEDDVVGYAVGSHIGVAWAVFTFHRGDHEPWGVMPYLLREMSALYPDRQWINDGPAVRKPGLAWFKERFTSNARDVQLKPGWIRL